jgi:hypothetical protein
MNEIVFVNYSSVKQPLKRMDDRQAVLISANEHFRHDGKPLTPCRGMLAAPARRISVNTIQSRTRFFLYDIFQSPWLPFTS